MNPERFEKIKQMVESMSEYEDGVEHPLCEIEHYASFEEKDVVLVARLAKITEDEAREFLNELAKRAVEEHFRIANATEEIHRTLERMGNQSVFIPGHGRCFLP